jgi:ATP-dependent Clp protease adaptor protein ClpS
MFPKLQFLIVLSLSVLSSSVSAFSVGGIHSRTSVARSFAAQSLAAAGPSVLEPPVKDVEKVKENVEDKEASFKKGGWAVRLFNDPMNKREFVAMCLSKIAGLTDGQAYQVMMQAHKQGVAIVGRYDLERAELYRNSFSENGLSSDMIPVDED